MLKGSELQRIRTHIAPRVCGGLRCDLRHGATLESLTNPAVVTPGTSAPKDNLALLLLHPMFQTHDLLQLYLHNDCAHRLVMRMYNALMRRQGQRQTVGGIVAVSLCSSRNGNAIEKSCS